MEQNTRTTTRDMSPEEMLSSVDQENRGAHATTPEHEAAPKSAFESALLERYDTLDRLYPKSANEHYTTQADRLVTGLASQDARFAMDDAEREVFGKGVAAALYNHTDIEAKTAALREVIDLYTSSKTTTHEAPAEPVAVEHEAPAETTRGKLRAKLGRFSLSRAYWSVHARMADRAEKTAEKYAPRDTDSRVKKIGRYVMRNGRPLLIGAAFVGSALSKYGVESGHLNGLFDHSAPSIHPQGNELDAMPQPDIKLAANADIIVPTNGRGNGNNPNGVPLLGALGGKNARIQGIEYPGGIRTVVTPEDPATLDQSVTIASDKQYNVYEKNPGQKITYVGYSEGGVTQAVTEARIRQANGGVLPPNVHFVYIGTPGIKGGAAENPYWDAIPASIKKSQNIESFGTQSSGGPNVHYYANESDFWAAANTASPIDMADKAIGTAFGGTHGAYGGNIPSTTVRNPDGSLTTTYHGGNNVVNGYRLRSGISNALYQNQGIPITREMDEAILAMRGDENGNYDAAQITDTLAKAAERQQPGTGNFVRVALGTVLTQELVDTATQVQNAVPEAIAGVTNPGASNGGGMTELNNAITNGMANIGNVLSGQGAVQNTGGTPAPVWQAPVAPAWQPPVAAPEYVSQGVTAAQNLANNVADQATAAAGGNQQVAGAIRDTQNAVNGLLGSLGR